MAEGHAFRAHRFRYPESEPGHSEKECEGDRGKRERPSGKKLPLLFAGWRMMQNTLHTHWKTGENVEIRKDQKQADDPSS